MENARNTKREKEEREKKAFVNGENWNRDNPFTKPKPFNLSYVKLNMLILQQTVDEKERNAKILKQQSEYELKECSFKPKINQR